MFALLSKRSEKQQLQQIKCVSSSRRPQDSILGIYISCYYSHLDSAYAVSRSDCHFTVELSFYCWFLISSASYWVPGANTNAIQFISVKIDDVGCFYNENNIYFILRRIYYYILRIENENPVVRINMRSTNTAPYCANKKLSMCWCIAKSVIISVEFGNLCYVHSGSEIHFSRANIVVKLPQIANIR